VNEQGNCVNVRAESKKKKETKRSYAVVSSEDLSIDSPNKNRAGQIYETSQMTQKEEEKKERTDQVYVAVRGSLSASEAVSNQSNQAVIQREEKESIGYHHKCIHSIDQHEEYSRCSSLLRC
jgi:hypothetical protein